MSPLGDAMARAAGWIPLTSEQIHMRERERLLTGAQRAALEWFRKRGGDGMFDRNGVLLAQGETAPIERKTWNALRDAGFVEMYNPTPGKGRGRMRLTQL